MINESFLSYIWQFRLFEHHNLSTIAGEPLTVLQTGECNAQSGPDFFNARLQIGETVWAGNVEIHVKASDWLKHGHQHDKTYDNVILHVVWEADIPLQSTTGQTITCVALDGRVNPIVYRNYQYLSYSQHKIPCAKLLPKVDDFTKSLCIERLLIERLAQKTEPLQLILTQNHYHWEETFYHLLCRALGSKANSDQMEQVAKSLPLNILAKHKDKLNQLEALFLGQAGLLDDTTLSDPYPLHLQQEYRHLRAKYQLRPIPAHSWKFGGLRPPNFPTIRLAQLATLVHQSNHLFSKIINTDDPAQLLSLFAASASAYWDTHYTFDKTTAKRSTKSIGNNTLHLIIINTVVPLLFLYGKERALPDLQDRILRLLEQIPPENNGIIAEWQQLKMPTRNAFDTQALLQLYNEYCQPKRCLACAIGNKLLRTEH